MTISDSKKRAWALRHAKSVRFGSYFTFFVYIFLMIIPDYYYYIAKLPVKSELNVDSGIFTLQERFKKRRGHRIGLLGPENTKWFTCSNTTSGTHDSCGNRISRRDVKQLVGKQAVISWYKQPIYLFISQNRIVTISVDGEELIGYETTKKRIERQSSRMPWWMLGKSIFIIWLIVYFERSVRGIKQ